MRYILLLAITFLSCQLNAQQHLTTTETAILKQVNSNIGTSYKLLKELVDVNSGTLNTSGVQHTGEILGKRFKSIGFKSEWIGMPEYVKRGGHLVATIHGNKGKKLLLLGHLDTVFEPDSTGTNSFKYLNDSTVTGQGVLDMKSGDVIIYAALKSLNDLGLLKDATITAYFTGDEENSGKPEIITRGDLIERAKHHDIALAYEEARNLIEVATARRGSSSWQLKVYGIQAHSYGVFDGNYGSIYETARILNNFREALAHEQYLTFNPGLIAGGKNVFYDSARLEAKISGKTNIISPFTEVTGDLRFLTEEQKIDARKKMQSIVQSDNLPGTHAEISFLDGIPSMEPTTRNEQLVTQLSDISVALGIGVVHSGNPGSRGAGDISYIAKYLSALDGLGGLGKGSHAPGEYLDLNSFEKQVAKSAILIYRLTR